MTDLEQKMEGEPVAEGEIAKLIAEVRSKAAILQVGGVEYDLDELTAFAFGTMNILADCLEQEHAARLAAELRAVDLALELAQLQTADDRKRILESENVRSIMDMRLK